MSTENQILPAVAAIIFNKKAEILLQKRKDVNQWCLISGHVEFGESIDQAILREIREETDCAATIIRLIGVYSFPDSQTYTYPGKNIQYVTSYFEAELHEEILPGFSNNETLELKFFAPENLPGNMAQMNVNWLSDALSKKGHAFIR